MSHGRASTNQTFFRLRTCFVFRKSFVFPASLAHARYSSRMIDKPKNGKIIGRCQPLLDEANRKTKTWPSRQANVEVYHQQPSKSCKLGLHLLVPVKEPKVSWKLTHHRGQKYLCEFVYNLCEFIHNLSLSKITSYNTFTTLLLGLRLSASFTWLLTKYVQLVCQTNHLSIYSHNF